MTQETPEPGSKPPTHARVPEHRRASEYLANERTFLAWIRTSIALISLGFLITRVAPWIHHSPAGQQGGAATLPASFLMGLAMMGLGAVVSILAVWRYHVVNRAIDEGQVKADRGLVILVTFLVVTLAVGMSLFAWITD
jgi:putative membrane protein